ncbi:vWA domain-containing protein [Roseovarius sp. 2305UL8-3]|uniref:vWA domain-containing protein n=1 Tax=Roseovarius conchicola TaxID=3121636 RepID=UPI003529CAD8
MALSLAVMACLSAAPGDQAEALACSRDAMLVFDGSVSMAAMGYGIKAPPRIAEARDAMAEVLPKVAPLRRIGLLVYGPGMGDVCGGIDVKFAPIEDAADPILDALRQIAPTGLTPLTASVHEAANVLEHETRPGIVVLVTDGSETCGGMPCQLGAELAATSDDLTVHVIGFRLVYDPLSWNSIEAFREANDAIRCMAEETGGLYVETETVEELSEALKVTLGCALIGSGENGRQVHGVAQRILSVGSMG